MSTPDLKPQTGPQGLQIRTDEELLAAHMEKCTPEGGNPTHEGEPTGPTARRATKRRRKRGTSTPAGDG
jgi:hypothetical protein